MHYLRPSLELELIWASTTGSFCYLSFCYLTLSCTMDLTRPGGFVAGSLSGPSLELELSHTLDTTPWNPLFWLYIGRYSVEFAVLGVTHGQFLLRDAELYYGLVTAWRTRC